MCGIVGFVDPGEHTESPEVVLHRMRDTLSHRGPDDMGAVASAPVWLGHRRLSIVDVSAEGRQPFDADVDGARIISVANGEIYNHDAIRRTLASRWPHARFPLSDCAVLTWAWAMWGEALPEHLEGMFGMAVWDCRREMLLLARDRAGQKPVYYASLPSGGLAFASEPKALLAHPLVGREIDALALRRYLTFDYVPGSATIYQGIRRLEPGTILVWHQGHHRVRRYFDAPSEPNCDGDLASAGDALFALLGESVTQRLMADVPLGVFLSGGLDSSAIVAALAERVPASSIKTFAIGFDDASFDESSHARTVAAHFGTTHHERILKAEDVTGLVPEILQTLDEPFADASIVPTYLLSRFAREHVTVALGGDGGDELFLGYPTFRADSLARWAARSPRWIRNPAVAAMLAMTPVSDRHMSFDFKLRRFASALDMPPDHRHPVWVGGVHPEQHVNALQKQWLSDDSGEALFSDIDELGRRYMSARPDASDLERVGWQYFGTYLSDGVLTKVDRASMAHGLEVRAPFLDTRMVRFAQTLPLAMKHRGTRTKIALRSALADRVPSAIRRRPKKGFGMPLAGWLRGPLRGWMEHVLSRDKVTQGGLLNPDWTDRLVREHVSGRVNHHKPLWTALALELWRRGPYGPGG